MANDTVDNYVIKAFTTLKDAQNDTNPLKRTANTNQIVNGEQDAGYNFFTHQEYFFRIEANGQVKEFYIDWDDGDNNDPLDLSNFSKIVLDPPSNVAITSHIFTRDPTQTAESYASGTTYGHHPKIAVVDTKGFKSKYYMPHLSRFLGLDILKGESSLPTLRNNNYVVESDSFASNYAAARIPVFAPTPKPPVAVLKADKKRIYAGINNELLVGAEVDTMTISDMSMSSQVGTVVLSDNQLGKNEIYPGNRVVINSTNSTYDETVVIKEVTAGNTFTYDSTIPSVADLGAGSTTGYVAITTHRGAMLKLVSNYRVQSTRTAVQVEVTYRTFGKTNTAGDNTGYQGGHGDIRVDVLSFGGTTTTELPCIELLKVELLDLKEATADDDTDALYPGERLCLKIDDLNGEKVYSQYKMIAEVSLGNPIVEVGHKNYTVTYDATESFSRVPEHSITDYYLDTGHDYWMSHGNYGPKGAISTASDTSVQSVSSTQVSDELSDFKGDTLKVPSGIKATSYSFVPAMEFLDEDNRWLPKQVLARAQIQTTTPNAQQHDAKATYTKSYLTHWRDESGGNKPSGTMVDYSSTREGIANYNWPDDMLSSNLIAFHSPRGGSTNATDPVNLGGNNVTDVDAISQLWRGPGTTNNAMLHWNYVNTGRRVGGPVGNISSGHGGPTTLEHEDNIAVLTTCSSKKFTELYFKVTHGYHSMMATTNTNTSDNSDPDTGDPRYLYHSTPEPKLANESLTLLTASGNNGTRKHNHQLNRITGLYTAEFGDTNYEMAISDLDFNDTSSAEPVIATVTTGSTAHGLSVGDEVFIDCQHTVTGTASSGSTTTLVDSGVLSEVDNYWIGAVLTITGGTNSGTTHLITDSDSSSTRVTFDSISAAMDSTSVYSIVKDYSECVVIETVPSSTSFTYRCRKQVAAEDVSNLTGTVRGVAQLKPLKFLDKTRYEKHSYTYKDTSFYTSGVLRWEEPQDWVSVDPARVPDRFWPRGGNFEYGNNSIAAKFFSSDRDTYHNFYDFNGRWDHEYNKYGILWVLDTTNHIPGTSDGAVANRRYRDTQVLNCWISSETHCVTVEVVDPMHISLNDRAISQSVSYVHKGKYQIIEDRMGLSEIRKIGNSGGAITFGGIDLLDADSATYTRDKFHQYQRRATPVYLDITHKSNNKTRFFGTITEMSEDHPVGTQHGKFGITLQCTHILQIDSDGHKLEDGFISLGGDPLDESKFIR